jgi:hypothetical protein
MFTTILTSSILCLTIFCFLFSIIFGLFVGKQSLFFSLFNFLIISLCIGVLFFGFQIIPFLIIYALIQLMFIIVRVIQLIHHTWTSKEFKAYNDAEKSVFCATCLFFTFINFLIFIVSVGTIIFLY